MSYSSYRKASSQRGFTLIELLITLVIIGILSAIAYPSFIEAIRKSRRADAIALLIQAQQAQERFRANNPTYASSSSALGIDDTSPDKHYTLTIANNSSTPFAYSMTADAKESSPQYNDIICRSFTIQIVTINNTTTQTTYTSKQSNKSVNSSNPDPCWRK